MPGGRGQGWGGRHGHGWQGGRGAGGPGSGRGGGWGAPLEPAVLAVLASGSAHGYDLRGAIEHLAGTLLPADPGGLYRLLRRMEDDGLVTSTWAEGSHGPQRRQYQLTRDGLEALGVWREQLERRSSALRAIVAAIDSALTRTSSQRAGDDAGSDQKGQQPCQAETEPDHRATER